MKNIAKKLVSLIMSIMAILPFSPIKNVFAEELNKSNPKISVIMPVYKVEKDLDKSLKTIENQTFKDIEIICVNDGSPDNCLEILKEHAEKDSRIKIISQENQGLSEARNVGLRAAKGEYVYFCDSDDYVLPHVLEKSMEIFDKYENLDAVEFGVSRVDYEKDINFDDYIYSDDNNLKLLECAKGQNPFKVFKTRGWGVWKYVYRKSFLNDNNLEFKKGLRIHEDILFGYLTMPSMKRIVRDKNVGYIYRLHRPGSITTSDCKIAKKKLEGFIEIINEIMANHKRFNFVSSNNHVLNFMIYIVFNKIKNIGTPEDRRHYAKIVYNNLWNNFVKKYKFKLSDKNAQKLNKLKLWANESEKEKSSGSTKNAIKRKNKKLQHNSAHRPREIHARG